MPKYGSNSNNGASNPFKDFSDQLTSTQCDAQKILRETKRYSDPDTISQGQKNTTLFRDYDKEHCDRHEKKMQIDNGGCRIM